ncbi:hypothetical protein JKP88DRAFT_241188 [Tribonema minus]|uniref:Uncharacterized protein n=1 Tax=Tribonema minus TaxID=303371 RepID=A0A835YXZ9_9STRA|nr:hypothetical protein JKP88DRAFT_241188 [Tribonema minus]
MQALLDIAPRGCRVRVGEPDNDCDSLSLCTAYAHEGYSSMNFDSARNAYFKDAIAACHARRWLEVGVGAHATLSRMVLDGAPQRTLTGVEVLASSAKSARRCLREYGKDRFHIVETSSYDMEGGPFDALLCEVVGAIASAEGIVDVVDDLCARGILTPLCHVIPTRVETFFAPVSLTARDLKRGGLYVTTRFASVKPASFDDTTPTRDRGLLEQYDLYTGTRTTAGLSAFTIHRECAVHGIGMYIVLDGALSSCHGRDDAGKNWRMPVALFDEVVNVRTGDVMNIASRVTSVARRHSYAFECERGGDRWEVELKTEHMYASFA